MKTLKTKYISLIVVTLMVIEVSAARCQENKKVWQWITSLGSSSWDYINGIKTDSKGNVYVAGAYNGELYIKNKDFETKGKQDLFVAQYNRKGKLQWVWSAGGSQADKITALYVTANDDILVSGIITGKVTIEKQVFTEPGEKLILAKLTSKGKLDWIKSFPVANTVSFYQLTETGDSEIIVAGTFKKELIIEGQQVISKGKEDLLIIRFSSEGSLIDIKSYGSKGRDVITAFAINENDDIYLSARYQGEMNVDKHQLASPGKGAIGAFIASLNKEFETNWLSVIEGEQYVHVSAIAPSSNNELYITGNFSHQIQLQENELESKGGIDFFTAKLNEKGEPIWINSYGTPYSDYANNIVLNPAGGIMLNGTFNDTLVIDTVILTAPEGKSTAFVSQINPEGKVFWIESLGGKTNVSSNYSTLDRQGNIYLSGSFTRTMLNDKFKVESNGDEDIYIAKYLNCPTYENTIYGDTYLCPGGESELKVKGDFDNIIWNDGQYAGKKIAVTEPGIYYVQMTDQYACLVQDTIVIEQVTEPEFDLGNDTILFTDQSIVLIGPDNMNNYLWYNHYTMPMLRVEPEGEYSQQVDVWLRVTDSSNCQFTDSVLVEFEPRSPIINISQAHELLVYPNPVREVISWSLTCDEKASLLVELINIEGRKVYSEKIYNYSPGEIKTIEVRDLPSGNYYLSIGNTSDKITTMVVIVNE